MANFIDTDCFKFNEQKLLATFRETISAVDKSQTKNLIECKDDMIFVWNCIECSVMCLNWRAANAREFQSSIDMLFISDYTIFVGFYFFREIYDIKILTLVLTSVNTKLSLTSISESLDKAATHNSDNSIQYQTLMPSTSQNYIVDKITASQEGSFLAIFGNRGVSILELPRRYGPNGTFSEGREKIICSSYNLDERFFTNNIHLEVLQVRWHPVSPKDSHLLVLLSNNSIRVYDETTLSHVWRVGPIPCAVPPTGSNFPYLNSLGDTAVDFDIGPPRVVESNNDAKNISALINDSTMATINRVEWPLIILRGNGTLYVMLIGIETVKPHLQGPLSIYPSTDDNYGLDSCSLIVLPSLPPTIILSESSGKIHHALLIDIEKEEEIFNEIDASLTIYPSQYAVQVLETLTLEMGISEKDNKNSTSCPIHLKRDITDESRYFAYHNTGLHAITVNFVRDLQQFIDSDDSNVETTNLLGTPSRAEYLVCTKALNSSSVNPVLGFTQLQSPSGLVLILASGQVVSLSLMIDPGILREPQRKVSNNEKHVKQLQNSEFEAYIKNILSTKVLQPILKLNNASEPSPKESIELLMHAVQVLREQYFPKLNNVKTEIDKRVKYLQVLKEQQKQEIVQLQREKDKDKDVSDKQQILFKRAQEVVRLATLKTPDSAAREKDFQRQIEKINLLTKTLSGNISIAKKKMEKLNIQMDQFNKENVKKTVILQPKVEKTILEILSELHDDIREQTEQIKRFKEHLNLS